ncbi:MAG: DNA polymerase III subunit chi [Betaproteobacteria bacterium]|nr:DNA polymerase III subunit chi [Betaproteobacteria bacterium]
MTRIEFRTDIADKISYTCRWVRKALSLSPTSKIVLFVQDKTQLARLDEALWTFSDQDFLPHVTANDPKACHSPVILTDSDTAPLPHHQILVNLSDTIPSCFAQFERLLEIISTDQADRENGRQRYAHYRQRGYTLHHEAAR